MTQSVSSDPRPESVLKVSNTERNCHRNLVLRHIDTISEVLAAEEYHSPHRTPCGCPHSTPTVLAHKRQKSDQWGCIYEQIETLDSVSTGCQCDDPLVGSDDPLDTVAATVLSKRDGLVERYFDHEERRLVANLRESVGEWSKIAEYSVEELHCLCEEHGSNRGISRRRVEWLSDTLDILTESSLVQGTTLRDLPSRGYNQLWEILAELPNISDSDAWWLLLVALDKPVWPADPEIDRLLLELGLISPDGQGVENGRRTQLEEQLTSRQLLPLHRGLAAHVKRCSRDHSDASCEFRKFTLSYRQEQQQSASKGPKVVDLFAGAGGLSQGFSSSGAQIALAVDNDQYATDTYRLNHPEVPHRRVRCEDVGSIAENDDLLSELQPSVDLVVGGPPCQALSVAGYRARLSDDDEYSVLDDPRTDLYEEYVSILETLEPTFLVMENVEGILNEVGDTGCRVIEKVRKALEKAGYSARAKLIDCSQFDIPQDRQRVIVFGVRQSEFEEPKQVVDELFEGLKNYHTTEEVDIQQALSNLPRIRRGQGSKATVGQMPGRPSRYVRDNGLNEGTSLTYNHRARVHPMDKDQELFSDVMEPGDTGWQVKYEKGREDLIDYDVGTRENPKFSDKYRMLHWDRPSPTIVAHLAKDGNSFILPDYYQYVRSDTDKQDDRRNRGITPREAARIQTFPDSYLFLGPFTSQYRQIGNAVPPILGENISEVLQSKLEEIESAIVRADTPGQAAPATTDD
jgi:DNA (cytosine-5)-methyltransferase 1